MKNLKIRSGNNFPDVALDLGDRSTIYVLEGAGPDFYLAMIWDDLIYQ